MEEQKISLVFRYGRGGTWQGEVEMRQKEIKEINLKKIKGRKQLKKNTQILDCLHR